MVKTTIAITITITLAVAVAAVITAAIYRGQVADLQRDLIDLERGIAAHQSDLDRAHAQISRIYDLVPRNQVTTALSAGDVLDMLTARLVAEGHPVVVHRSGP